MTYSASSLHIDAAVTVESSLIVPGGSITAGDAGAQGKLILHEGNTGGDTVTIDVTSDVTDWTMTLPAAAPAGTDYVMESDTDGNLTWLNIGNDYAAIANGLEAFAQDSTSSAGLADILDDETGFDTGSLAVFSKSPTIETPTIAALPSNTLTLGTGTFTALTINAGATDPTLTFGSDELVLTNIATFTPENNSVTTAALIDEVRSMVWNAGAMSTDGTDCEDPAELVLNSGPKQFGITCPMGSTDTDGYIYGSTVLPDGFETDGDLRFLMTSIMITDSGAGTFHGSLGFQCVANRETVDDASWGAEADLDLAEADDVQWDTVTATLAGDDSAIAATGCAGGETFWWRWVACDQGNVEHANCQQSTGAMVEDLTILSLRMEYTTTIGD
jgi:hypothetical protein